MQNLSNREHLSFFRRALLATIGFVLLIPASANAAVTTTVVDIPTRGVTQRILYLRPDAPIANIIFLHGGDGLLDIQPNGTILSSSAQCSPVVRNRDTFAQQGFAVALVDHASDGSLQMYADVLEVYRYMRSQNPVPTWIIGGSASTVTTLNFALTLPPSEPLGVAIFSPEPGHDGSMVKRPTLVIYHVSDPLSATAAGVLYRQLVSAPAEIDGLSGGSDNGCGYHLFQGIDAKFVGGVTDFIKKYNATLTQATSNYQGLWWAGAAESGWGINFAHQGDVIFATWFTYDANGKAWWLTMTANKTADGVYGGQLIQTSGAPFFAYTPPATTAVVGSATITFTSATTAAFAYTVNGISQTKAISLQAFGPLPTCVWGAQADLSLATNYQDLWWATGGTESGWGINLTQQGATIFATWFTYDANHNPLWYSVSAPQTGSKTYAGTLIKTSGPAFSAMPFDGSMVQRTTVGTATLTFTDGNAGTFTYQVADGANAGTQTKAITRQVFRAPGTVCQ